MTIFSKLCETLACACGAMILSAVLLSAALPAEIALAGVA